MPKSQCLAPVFAAALVALSAVPSHAQAPQRISVEWQNAALADVVGAFSKFSGRTIVLATDIRSSEVTASVQGLEWWRALDVILDRQALVAREDTAGIIHVENRAPARPRPQSRT